MNPESVHQRATDAPPFDQRLDRDDLDTVRSFGEGREARSLTAVHRDEGREYSSVDHLPETGYLRRAPTGLQGRALPILIIIDDPANR